MAYNKKIKVYELTEVSDGIGQLVQKWNRICECWARISHISGKEYYAASQINSQNDIRVYLRYTRRIADKSSQYLRIEYNSNIYDVKSISDYLEKHTEIELRCSEVPDS